MYLKRLEMKGFKSFADKVSVTLEPGISAIVGPNGSGKSNICDAILWVLGERNAKSLRGAVMEDVIFAGSSKRSAVSVAEVTLVLDNTDGLLPIEYNEVSVSRRLYRSGESEYLINGVTSRRLDVLDILHDSGIGTDTNSIISQGHLDSILQSKPMDRRTLIEEAAGVLKHKQRKIRSQRKLERMELNLERIGDVMAEIERQLKPLRIKAKRAAAYDGLVAEASELTLEIAVDDLKKIKASWDKVENEKKQLQQSVDEKRKAYQQKDEELAELRKKIATQNSDIVEYSAKQRRLNSDIEKLSTSSILLKQKAQNAREKFDTLSEEAKTAEAVSPAKKQILDEISGLKEKLRAMKNEQSEIQGQGKNANKDAVDTKEKLEKLQEEYQQKQESLNSFQKESEDFNTKIKIAESIKDSLDKKQKLDKISEDLDKNQNEIVKQTEKSSKELEVLDTLNSELNEVNANILALEKMLETSYDEASDASKWLSKNKSKFNNVENLSDIIDVPEKYLHLVETLLGSYSSSFSADVNEISKINAEVKNAEDANGSLRLVANGKNDYVVKTALNSKAAAEKLGGICLSDEVKTKDSNVFGLVSNVVVFDNSDQAFKAAKNNNGIVFASLDGTIVYPDGRYLIGGPFYVDSAYDSDSSRTILSYKKNLEKLNKNAKELNEKVSVAQNSADKIDEEIKNLREKEIYYKNDLATLKAEYDFSQKYIEELKSSLTTSFDDKNINVDQIKNDLEKLKQDANDAKEWMQSSESKLVELQKISEQKAEVYNTFVIKEAAIEERINSQNDAIESAKLRLTNLEDQEKGKAEEIKFSSKLAAISDRLSDLFQRLSALADKDLKQMDAEFSSANAAVADIQKQSDEAINASSQARKLYDTENQKLSEIQVELGKLEVKVQNAVDTIDGIEGISVDKALEMPDIEDRPGKEEKLFKIRRRIANMGVINPDAKQEYDILKERYDFLNGQVQDLHAAKISLSKIDKIIDERMRDDFINTFNEVNANFQEIFAILFPGGRAKLELELPNDIENSGVEVKAQPHGKLISKMSLLSGGEKSLVALCLLFAVYKKRSTPFYILDEVEAALDDTNLRRLIKYLEDLREATQLIMITHQRRTMEMADVLYGVSMKNDGVTRVVSQRLDKDNRLHDIDK